MARTDRLMRLMDALRRLKAPVTAARLAEETGVSERQLYRDIATLRAGGALIDGAATVCVAVMLWYGSGLAARMGVQLPFGSAISAGVLVAFIEYLDRLFRPLRELSGKVAILQGTATRETVDVATLRHYAEDAGKSQDEIEAITEPETSIGFIAEGVLIRD